MRAAADALGLQHGVLDASIKATSDRIARNLGITFSPLEVAGADLLATKIAGLVRVSDALELEIAPKFLGTDQDGWHDDFFLAATLSKFGKMLPRDRLPSRADRSNDLALLIARNLISWFEANRRRPVRTYRRTAWRDFGVEGDLDEESVLTPDADGFLQESVRYSRDNPYNRMLRHAAHLLTRQVREPNVRAQLERIAVELTPQTTTSQTVPRRVPSRSRQWQVAYDLSVDVVHGFGRGYGNNTDRLPGYILDTWRVWQDLITWSARSMRDIAVEHPFGIQIGTSKSPSRYKGEQVVRVHPDIVVDIPGKGRVVVDAKYKGRPGEELSISEADLYESLAFANAARVKDVVLVYPHSGPMRCGGTEEFERIDALGISVRGVRISVRGIANVGGLAQVVAGLEHELTAGFV